MGNGGQLKIQHCDVDNLKSVLMLADSFHKEGNIPGTFIPEVFVKTWSALILAGTGDVFVAMSKDDAVAMLGAIVYPDPNDGVLVATEMFWYVASPARGRSLVGIRLFEHFESWAKEKGAERVLMIHLLDLGADKLAAFYEKRGYRPIETHYIKEL